MHRHRRRPPPPGPAHWARWTVERHHSTSCRSDGQEDGEEGLGPRFQAAFRRCQRSERRPGRR
jgi:hypothetical protein